MERFSAILIAFDYKNTEIELPGTVIDLYRSYLFFKNKSKINNIFILTDITDSPVTSKLLPGIQDGIANSDILDFIPNLKKTNNYFLTNTLNEFLKNLKQILKSDIKFLTVYYTGHCKNSKLVFHNKEDYEIQNLEKLFSTLDTEILFILDCCSIKLSSTLERYIYILSGSEHNHKTVSTSVGSSFTRTLFEILSENENIEKNEIIKKFKESKESKDSHIFIIGEKIPEWVFGKRIRIFEHNKCIVMQNLNKSNIII